RLWRADEDLPPAGAVFCRRRLEGAFDPDRADVREERVPGRRTGLHGRAHEVAIEVEQRGVVRREVRRADHMAARGGLETDAHRRPAAAESTAATASGCGRRG